VHCTPLTVVNKLLKRWISLIALVPPYNGNNFQLRDDADWDAPCNEPVFLDELWGKNRFLELRRTKYGIQSDKPHKIIISKTFRIDFSSPADSCHIVCVLEMVDQ
jgi:hypothetical protein